MAVYWALFLVPAYLAFQRTKATADAWIGIAVALTLIVGLRYRVGGDWGAYRRMVLEFGQMTPGEILEQNREPLFRLLNWLAYNTAGEVWLVNLICAFLFAIGLISFVRRLPEPFLALTVAIPYLVIVVAMGYTRQAAAIGLILYGIKFFASGRIIVFLIVVVLASLFHRTAVVFGALAVFPFIQGRWLSAVVLLPMVYGMYVLILAEHQDRLTYSYIQSDYATRSTGGLIRVLLTGCFAAVYVSFRRSFELGKLESGLWLWVSVVSLALIPIATSFPTAADRVGLYFLPLQMVVASHLPSLVRKRDRSVVRGTTVVFFALVTAVWLFFADNRNSWLPYNFWLLASN